MKYLVLALVLLLPSLVLGQPSYVGTGTNFNNAASGAVALPADLAADDILILQCETADAAITVSNANGGTWTEVADSPQSATGTTRLTVFWSRYNGTQGNPTVSDSGDHQLCFISAFRNVSTPDSPFDVTCGGSETASDVSLVTCSDTTTVDNVMVLTIAAIDDDTDAWGATFTDSNQTSITERRDHGAATGNDGRHVLVTGLKMSAGSIGPVNNTLTSASTKAYILLALKGNEPPPPPTPGRTAQWQSTYTSHNPAVAISADPTTTLLVAHVARATFTGNPTATVSGSTSGSWTLLTSVTGSGNGVLVFYKVWSGALSETVTATRTGDGTGDGCHLSVEAWSNADPPDSDSFTTSSGDTSDPRSLTINPDGDLSAVLLAAAHWDSDTASWTSGTELYDVQDAVGATATGGWSEVGTTANTDFTFSFTLGGDVNVTHLIAYEIPASGGAPPATCTNFIPLLGAGCQ